MSKFDEFYSYANGKVFDTNGNVSNVNYVQWNYPLAGQCVSLIKAYNKYLGYGVKAYGNAIDYWNNRASNGILQICDVVSSPKNGDIVVSSGGDPRYGHIFIYKDGQAFTQNCCNNPRATIYPLSYQGTIYGYLRPKCLANSYNASQLQSEHGLATFTVDKLIVRRDSPTGADTGRRFNTGDKQEYTEKWVGNGHRYISWVENSVRYFVAVSNSETQGVQPWATFSAIEDKPITVDPSKLIQEDGIATLTTDIGVIARKNGPTGEAVRTYQPGSEIRYYWKWVGNGHRYIVWKEGNDYIFLAVSGSEEQGKDPWATFRAPEDINTPEKPSQGTDKPVTPPTEDPDDDNPNLVENPGYATFRNDIPIIIHKDSPDGPESGKMTKGTTQKFTWIYIGNGHQYIVWEENGTKYYCAFTGTEEDPVEGSDDQWAIITKEGEDLPDVKPDEPEESDGDVEQPDLEVEYYTPTKGWLEKNGVTLKQLMVPKDLWQYKCPYVIDKSEGGPCIHNSGSNNDPSAMDLSQSMINNGTQLTSWHFSVDEATVVQNLSLNRNCFAQGDFSTGWKSKNCISFEICRDMLESNNDKFLQAEINCAVVVADMMYQYGWDKMDISKHQDYDMLSTDGKTITHKYCPHKTLDLGWDRFVDIIMDKYSELEEFIKKDDPVDEDDHESVIDGTIDAGLINTLLKVLISAFRGIGSLVNKILGLFK